MLDHNCAKLHRNWANTSKVNFTPPPPRTNLIPRKPDSKRIKTFCLLKFIKFLLCDQTFFEGNKPITKFLPIR